MMHKPLAIIGGGASATVLLAHCARRKLALAMDVYDRTGAFARGIAYSTPHPCHLLNVRAANMSALADVPDDFVRWIARYGYGSDNFVPRALYGNYLASHLEQAQQTLPVSLIQKDVISVRKGTFYEVDGKRYAAVIQATGNCVPLRPRLHGQVGNYHDSPWDVDYSIFSTCNTIAILGCGLSAVDTILALQAHGYQGRIIMISRRALLPAVHVNVCAHPAWLHTLPATALAAFRQIRAKIKTTDAPWQSVIDALRPITNTLWAAWPERQQQRFMRHLFTYWNIHRHRMATQTGETLTALEHSGQLLRQRARINHIKAGPVIATCQGEIRADAVINCLGYRYAARNMDAAYTIGPSAFGRLFETTAIPEIRIQAAALAAVLTGTGT